MNAIYILFQRLNSQQRPPDNESDRLVTTSPDKALSIQQTFCADCDKMIFEDKDRVIWAFYGKCRDCWSKLMWDEMI